MEFSDSRKLITRKVLIQFFFIIFIILNIVDFVGIINPDVDFVKKLISWALIGYIFYKASFTQIVIGHRLKNYDLLFILAFSLISLTRALIHYVRTSDVTPENNPVFYPFLSFISSLDPSFAIQTTFILGLVLIVIGTVALLSNHQIEEKSFIGSLGIKEGYFKYLIHMLTLLFMAIFFGLIIFNFFMEWFALAVDSIILILGLIYYVFLYLVHHTSTKYDSILSSISNTGNKFYQDVIELFSNKKTLFVGISLLLTLHTMVDAGVYLVPYTLGTENTLYFSALDEGHDVVAHVPIFNILSSGTSRFQEDIASSSFISVKFAVFLIHFMILFLFYTLMIFPFFAYYKNTQNKHLNLPKSLVVIFLASLITWLFLFLIGGVNPPIDFSLPKTESISGVDIYTSSLSIDQNPEIFTNTVLKILLVFIISTVILWQIKNKWYIPLKKIMYAATLIFFTIYISMYYISTVEVEAKRLSEDLFLNNIDYSENERYKSYQNIMTSENTYRSIDNLTFEIDGVRITSTYFWTLIGGGQSHIDYIYFTANGFSERTTIKFNSDVVLYQEGVYDKISGEVYGDEISGYILLGSDKFTLREEGRLIDRGQSRTELTTSLFEVKTLKEESRLSKTERLLGYLRLVFLSIFYIFGMIGFIRFFIRKNIFIKDPIP